MLPSKWGEVRQLIWWCWSSLLLPIVNNLPEMFGVPVNDNTGEQIELHHA